MSTQIVVIRRADDGVADVQYYSDDEAGMDGLIIDYVRENFVQISDPKKSTIDVGEALIIRGTVMKMNIGLEELSK